jgi:hypothetical protein
MEVRQPPVIIATPEDLASFNRFRTQGAVDTDSIVPKLPPLPQDVLVRFPSLKAWHEAVNDEWRTKMTIALRGGVQ